MSNKIIPLVMAFLVLQIFIFNTRLKCVGEIVRDIAGYQNTLVFGTLVLGTLDTKILYMIKYINYYKLYNTKYINKQINRNSIIQAFNVIENDNIPLNNNYTKNWRNLKLFWHRKWLKPEELPLQCII